MVDTIASKDDVSGSTIVRERQEEGGLSISGDHSFSLTLRIREGKHFISAFSSTICIALCLSTERAIDWSGTRITA